MKILLLKDKDYEKIIDRLSDDYIWDDLLKLFQESVVIPTDIELIQVDKGTIESFEDVRDYEGMNNNETLTKLIQSYWRNWD